MLADDGNGGGSAQVWAVDFTSGSDLVDCFGNDVTSFGIVRVGDGVAEPSDSSVTVTCADFGDLVAVDVYAFDNAGNLPAEFCRVAIEVQEGDGVDCGTPGDGDIAGLILTQDIAPVEGVMVTLTGGDDMDAMEMTDATGAFAFRGVPVGEDYTIQPIHNVPVNLQEVKVSDVVKISSVILGTGTFDNAYDFIAADVDRNGRINVLDMVAIQRVILGLDDTYRSGDSWVFAASTYTVTSTNWMNAFPEVYNVNDLAGNLLDVDFVAVELGNVVNGQGRNSLNLETEDAEMEMGQERTIYLRGVGLAAFQGTLRLGSDLELIEVSHTGEGGLNLDHVAAGLIGVALRTAGEVSLTVRALAPVRLSEAIELTDDLVYQEGVDQSGGSTGLGLAFVRNLAPAAAQNVLYQNVPNPVATTTVIEFDLAKAGEAELTVRDVTGRLLLRRAIDAAAGRNSVTLRRAELGTSGVFTYTVESGAFRASRRMVVVRRQ